MITYIVIIACLQLLNFLVMAFLFWQMTQYQEWVNRFLADKVHELWEALEYMNRGEK